MGKNTGNAIRICEVTIIIRVKIFVRTYKHEVLRRGLPGRTQTLNTTWQGWEDGRAFGRHSISSR